MKEDRSVRTIEYDELLEVLDISEPSEFEYFENMADLIECEFDITEEAVSELFQDVEDELLAELFSSYFTDVLENVPDRASDIYMLLNTIGMNLTGLAKEKEVSSRENGSSSLAILAEEFNKFKKWYMLDTEITCKDVKHGHTYIVPVAEALALYREETVTDSKYEFDFDNALDYELSDYVMSFGDIVAAEYAENDDDYEEYHDNTEYMYGYHRSQKHGSDDEFGIGHSHSHGHMRHIVPEDLLSDGFVYDDEFDDDDFDED